MKNVANCENYCETHNIVNNQFLNAYCSEKACHLAIFDSALNENIDRNHVLLYVKACSDSHCYGARCNGLYLKMRFRFSISEVFHRPSSRWWNPMESIT
jgi:hypothetical protein